MFALDSFGIGLLIHLIPSIIIGLTYYLLRNNLIQRAYAFGGLAVFSVFFFNTYSDPIVLLIITGPLLIIALLSYLQRKGGDNDRIRTKHRRGNSKK